MKILLISGSPRKNGNTETLLNHASNFLENKKCEIFKFYVSENKVNPCQACDSCLTNNVCKVNDDMNKLYDFYKKCDGLIIGTPVYYRNVSAQLKSIFDRTYATKNIKPLSKKIGGAISIGRGTGSGQCFALSIIYNFLLSSGVICIPGELNGVSASADKPGEIINQENRLKQVEILCENMLDLFNK